MRLLVAGSGNQPVKKSLELFESGVSGQAELNFRTRTYEVGEEYSCLNLKSTIILKISAKCEPAIPTGEPASSSSLPGTRPTLDKRLPARLTQRRSLNQFFTN